MISLIKNNKNQRFLNFQTSNRKFGNKKGMTHIEMILSFVIFVGFSIFLFAIFNPFRVEGRGEVYLDVIERGIKENASIEVSFQTLRVDVNIEQCFCFGYDFKNIIVKNENYEFMEAKSGLDKVCINSKEKFFYISSSNDFVERSFDISDCTNLNEENYTLGLFRNYDFVSFNRLKELHANMTKNYENVKEQLGLPSTKEFTFGVRSTEIDEEIILDFTSRPGKGTRVLARDVPINLVYAGNEGKIKYAKLSILMW